MKLFSRTIKEIAPDEIFLDSSNLPEMNAGQFEGRIERPVSHRSIITVGIFFLCIATAFASRSFQLQIKDGTSYADISKNNTLQSSTLFATRGSIYDRNGTELAWSDLPLSNTEDATTTPYAIRRYTPLPGLAHLLGWVRYPRRDAQGNWWREEYTGMSGIELSFNNYLAGTNGSTMYETDARGRVLRENIISPPINGGDVHLSIDADMQSELYTLLYQHAKDNRFVGGAAVIMNVETGEILALTSFPEYDHAAFTDGDAAAVAAASNDPATPLLNRVVAGLYAPGSIVKPIFAVAALKEGLISPDKTIVSTGALSIPNPYDPSHPSVFKDWAVHGVIDMRTAIAVSSDEYFYMIGGGAHGLPGLGIANIDKYARIFGLGSTTGIALSGEQDGNIPTPAWKAKVFGPEDPWRLGDTYHTAIGQYGFQITPIQAVRYVAAIANGGKLLTPHLVASSTPQFTMIGIPDKDLEVAREGMRMAVTSTRPDATVKALNLSGIEIAGKTGTAQIGTHNQYMNSWNVGFWPASHPKYAYAVVLERAPAGTASGAAPGMLPFFEWLIVHRPQYVE